MGKSRLSIAETVEHCATLNCASTFGSAIRYVRDL